MAGVCAARRHNHDGDRADVRLRLTRRRVYDSLLPIQEVIDFFLN